MTHFEKLSFCSGFNLKELLHLLFFGEFFGTIYPVEFDKIFDFLQVALQIIFQRSCSRKILRDKTLSKYYHQDQYLLFIYCINLMCNSSFHLMSSIYNMNLQLLVTIFYVLIHHQLAFYYLSLLHLVKFQFLLQWQSSQR